MALRAWMARNKALADVGVYYALTAVNQAVPFFILPLITIYLSPADFGFINAFSSLLLIAASAFNGFHVTINKNFYTQDRDFNRLLLGNLYLLLFLGTLLFSALALVFVLWGGTEVLPRPYLLLIPLIAFFTVSLEFLKTIFKIAKKTGAFAALAFSEVLVNVSLSLFLVIGLSWRWHGRVAGIIASTVLFGLFALLFLVRGERARFRFDLRMFKDILRVALPLIPWGFSVMLMRRSGVLFIDGAFGKGQAGLYGVAMNLATVILFLAVPVINVWTPYLYEKLSLGAAPAALSRLYHKLLLLALGAGLVSLLFSLLSGRVLRLMTTEAFAGAGRFIPWLAFGFCLWMITALLTPFLVHFNRQKRIALIASACAAVNLGLNYILIRRHGPIGAAESFFAANLLAVLVMLETVRRQGQLPFFPSPRLLADEFMGIFKEDRPWT